MADGGSKSKDDRPSNELRGTMEAAALRLDRAWERFRSAYYGPAGKPDFLALYHAVMAIPGLTHAERMSRLVVPNPRPPESAALSAARGEYVEAREAFYSSEFLDQVERLRNGDQSAIECAIVFIEIDPWHFRSGYLKQKLARYLRHVPLSDSDAQRLRAGILAALTKGQREDLKEYIRLARVLDTPAFRAALQALATGPDEGTRWRAERMLVGLAARGHGGGRRVGSQLTDPLPPPTPS